MQLLWLTSEAAGWVWEEGEGARRLGCGPASSLGPPGNPTCSRPSSSSVPGWAAVTGGRRPLGCGTVEAGLGR